MLVLSRKEGEQLLIGDNIVLTVNRLSGNRVAIGIEAPKDVRIVRGELNATEEKSSDVKATAAPPQAKLGSRESAPLRGRGRNDHSNWAPISMIANNGSVSIASQADR
ncbi:hypothetical protein Q31b_40830 [Novipirellula aureliae]|uniref:Translational regulator CsrA n=1 Tax=Novipirellula aureliae TaxID=2527966 RepID=A0A5C6DNY2_9BACT|nr:carbon storage regulator [Novipirellula aureliae]TWU39003.1 hypothetical protein Q31b_40830 [Novipirellula aureliae]